MKNRLKPVAFAGAVILAVIYFVTVYLSVNYYGINFDPSAVFKGKIVELAVSVIFALSLIWFISDPNREYHLPRLIPAGAALTAAYIYRAGLSVNSAAEGIITLGSLICAGFLLSLAVKNIKKSAPKRKSALPIAGAVVLLIIALDSNFFYNIPYETCALLLPAMFIAAAKIINKAEEKYPKFAPFGTLSYFASASAMILIFYRDFRVMDVLSSVFLVAAAVIALWSVQKESFSWWFFGMKGRKFYSFPWPWAILMTIGFVFTNYRLTAEILPSASLPAAPDRENGYLNYQNWFSYRLEVLKDNLSGSFDSVRRSHLSNIPISDSLAWIRHAYGLFNAIVLLIFLGATLYLLYKCCGKNRLRLCLFAILSVRTAIGLAANLLLVFATDITPLMLGSMYDIALILGILMFKDWEDVIRAYDKKLMTLALQLFQNGEESKAYDIFKKVAKLGKDPYAKYVLGAMYFGGKDVEQSYSRAAVWFNRAIKGGVKRAKKTLKICVVNYLCGDPELVPEDIYERMKELTEFINYDRRPKISCEKFLYDLGISMMKEGNFKDSYNLMRCAAEYYNYPEAQNMTAVHFNLGKGVEQNDYAALYWFDKAANDVKAAKTDRDGIYNAYKSGSRSTFLSALKAIADEAETGSEDIPKDPEKAEYWRKEWETEKAK